MQNQSTQYFPTVLVVDDEPLLRMDVAATLEEAGCHVLEAANADEALQMMEGAAHIDLLVTDVQMPGSMDGIQLSAAVHLRWPDTEVMVTSGRIQPRAHELPPNVRFLAKPYPPYKLADVAMRLIH
jgi:two-component system, response regulator PdtaR